MKVGSLVKVTDDCRSTIGVVTEPCFYPFPESTCMLIKVFAWGEVCIFEPFEVELICK